MSGSYETENQTAQGGLADTAQVVQSLLAHDVTATASRQQDAEQFITSSGASVVDGHAPVGNAENY